MLSTDQNNNTKPIPKTHHPEFAEYMNRLRKKLLSKQYYGLEISQQIDSQDNIAHQNPYQSQLLKQVQEQQKARYNRSEPPTLQIFYLQKTTNRNNKYFYNGINTIFLAAVTSPSVIRQMSKRKNVKADLKK